VEPGGLSRATSTSRTRTSKMITTFLHDGELNVPTSNSTLNEVLAQVREADPSANWQVIERVTEKRYWSGLWFEVEQRRSYELYLYVGGIGPWQQINFYRENSSSSINTSNSADLVVAFLLGILAGLHRGDDDDGKVQVSS
jgi:hypothetical protein